jgi:acetyl-CoA carboxylase biotin carboxyl carrier protein
MDLDQLKQILDLVREHDLSELEVEHEGLKIRIRTNAAGTAVPVTVTPPSASAGSPRTVTAPGDPALSGPSASDIDSTAGEEEVELAVVRSPIVGTFYRSPEPAAPPFVDIGSAVKKGQVLCIIEAMKLMNEIDSEYDGEIVNVYVETGQPVQYGERLFAIRTA